MSNGDDLFDDNTRKQIEKGEMGEKQVREEEKRRTGLHLLRLISGIQAL